ncbi:ATP-binding protein [Microbacterium sp.]|uniref:ATP-binding protein n=1 Tax=Microbacterium sp. TaxID=51671 RepID=UPI003A9216D7
MGDVIPIGTAWHTAEPAHIRARGLNRHTFWCGQSGSGKTYALGVLLEQVLLHTRLPVIVLDPNSDFVRLGELRDGASGADAAELSTRDIRVLHSRPGLGEDLKVRLLDMDERSRAALLQLDPILDAEEFNASLGLVAQTRASGLPADGTLLEWLRASDNDVHHRFAMRLEDLGIADWTMWARDSKPVTEIIDEQPDATVVDLGKFDTSVEPKIAALAILDHLWERRHERIPRLIVIDEAHNLCPPNPTTAVERLLADRIAQIAAEGRKYGLWLLLSTQRPSKVHPNVISQCDNLALMRMNSPEDLAEIARIFGFAPADLLSRASQFTQGQSLFAGGFIEEPTIVQMGARLTAEGGSDVAVPLR